MANQFPRKCVWTKNWQEEPEAAHNGNCWTEGLWGFDPFNWVTLDTFFWNEQISQWWELIFLLLKEHNSVYVGDGSLEGPVCPTYMIGIHSFFGVFVWDPYLAMLRGYFWLCTRNYTWRCLRDHMGCWGLNPGQLSVRQMPYPLHYELQPLGSFLINMHYGVWDSKVSLSLTQGHILKILKWTFGLSDSIFLFSLWTFDLQRWKHPFISKCIQNNWMSSKSWGWEAWGVVSACPCVPSEGTPGHEGTVRE